MTHTAMRTEADRARLRAAPRRAGDAATHADIHLDTEAGDLDSPPPRPPQPGAEARLRRQTELMARAVHELRGPLMPILGVSALLAKGGGSTDPGRLASMLDRQVRHLSRLIDDLLDASRLATGRLRLQCARVDLVALLGQVVDACRPWMIERRQHFAVHLPEAPLFVEADEVRLAQVFANLLHNASKYTPQRGEITLRCKVEEGGPAAGTAVVTVCDSGVGISAAALSTIFDPFVQEPHAVEFDAQGLGIGLALVRELVQAHGGTVAASSAGRDAGSRFEVRLPLAGRPQRMGAPVPPPSRPGAG